MCSQCFPIQHLPGFYFISIISTQFLYPPNKNLKKEYKNEISWRNGSLISCHYFKELCHGYKKRPLFHSWFSHNALHLHVLTYIYISTWMDKFSVSNATHYKEICGSPSVMQDISYDLIDQVRISTTDSVTYTSFGKRNAIYHFWWVSLATNNGRKGET